MTNPSGWTLYWVASDGHQDCFVVARNSRSARQLECDTSGVDPQQVSVERVLSIPVHIKRAYARWRTKTDLECSWPCYADDWLLRRLGAQFREIEETSEVLINETVYTRGAKECVAPRRIGRRGIQELLAKKEFHYEKEDEFTPSQMHLFTMLGGCVARCQEIERLIAHSFILGVSDFQKRQYTSIKTLIDSWKKKTLGRLLALIEDSYEIEPSFKTCLSMFLSMRNTLIHGATTGRYDINTAWGQDELVTFLTFFELLSRTIRKAFIASFYASIEFRNKYLLQENQAIAPLTKGQQKDVALFIAFFKPKGGSQRQDDGTDKFAPTG